MTPVSWYGASVSQTLRHMATEDTAWQPRLLPSLTGLTKAVPPSRPTAASNSARVRTGRLSKGSYPSGCAVAAASRSRKRRLSRPTGARAGSTPGRAKYRARQAPRGTPRSEKGRIPTGRRPSSPRRAAIGAAAAVSTSPSGATSTTSAAAWSCGLACSVIRTTFAPYSWRQISRNLAMS